MESQLCVCACEFKCANAGVHVCVCVLLCAMTCMWTSEEWLTWIHSILLFGDKCPYLLSLVPQPHETSRD